MTTRPTNSKDCSSFFMSITEDKALITHNLIIIYMLMSVHQYAARNCLRTDNDGPRYLLKVICTVLLATYHSIKIVRIFKVLLC